MICVVTGGAGFIGSALVRRLLEAGATVRVLDDFSSGRRENLMDLVGDLYVIEGDICDPSAVAGVAEGAQAIFHLAAVASVPQSVSEPVHTNRVNVEGTINILEAARAQPGTRVVFASSSAVYGSVGPFPKVELHSPHVESPYALHKLVGEQYAAIYHELHGVQTACLRLFNVFGPRQRPDSDYAAVIPAFVDRLHRGEPLTIFGDGKQTRDFVFVDDVARAFHLGAHAELPNGTVVVNIGTAARRSLLDLVESLQESTGRRADVHHAEPRVGDVRDSWADISAAESALGWEPRVSFRDGLRMTWDAFTKEPAGR